MPIIKEKEYRLEDFLQKSPKPEKIGKKLPNRIPPETGRKEKGSKGHVKLQNLRITVPGIALAALIAGGTIGYQIGTSRYDEYFSEGYSTAQTEMLNDQKEKMRIVSTDNLDYTEPQTHDSGREFLLTRTEIEIIQKIRLKEIDEITLKSLENSSDNANESTSQISPVTVNSKLTLPVFRVPYIDKKELLSVPNPFKAGTDIDAVMVAGEAYESSTIYKGNTRPDVYISNHLIGSKDPDSLEDEKTSNEINPKPKVKLTNTGLWIKVRIKDKDGNTITGYMPTGNTISHINGTSVDLK